MEEDAFVQRTRVGQNERANSDNQHTQPHAHKLTFHVLRFTMSDEKLATSDFHFDTVVLASVR